MVEHRVPPPTPQCYIASAISNLMKHGAGISVLIRGPRPGAGPGTPRPYGQHFPPSIAVNVDSAADGKRADGHTLS